MNDYDDLDTYNGDVEHDMWVDYDYHAKTAMSMSLKFLMNSYFHQ